MPSIPRTKDQLADHFGLGYHDYDTALPQDWWDHAHEKTGENPVDYNIVWCHKDSLLGFPLALDWKAARFLYWVGTIDR